MEPVQLSVGPTFYSLDTLEFCIGLERASQDGINEMRRGESCEGCGWWLMTGVNIGTRHIRRLRLHVRDRDRERAVSRLEYVEAAEVGEFGAGRGD